MSTKNRWLLPAGIEEVLPENAAIIESTRRKCLDLFNVWGYQMVIPPLIEFLDSLLLGDCEDLDLQTFKLTDQMSGRSMGIHADMTPQVARIEAHRLGSQAPTRLCYCDTVLHTLPESSGGTRSPMQIGAELYGHTGLASDVEIIQLMETMLTHCGIDNILMDLGHTGIVDTLMDQLALGKDFNQDFLSIIQRKSEPDMATLLSNVDASCELKNACMSIITLHGKADVLTRAREQLNLQETAIPQQLDYLEELSSVLKTRLKATDLHFDLAESRGYHYQQGVVFTAFCAQQGQELARGGRYDNIGENFGRARPATGFSADLKKLIEVSDANTDNPSEVIFAPAQDDSALLQKIQELRTDGHIVVTGLSAHAEAIESENCSKILVCENGQWMIKDKS